MSGWWLILALGLPPLLVLAALVPWTRRLVVPLAPLAPWPAFLIALAGPTRVPVFDAPWLLLGARFGLDGLARPLVLLTAALWSLAAAYGVAYLRGDAGRFRFFVFFLSAMTGNLTLLFAQDVPTFYLAFALMSFSTYGLVVHDGTAEARRAGRVYLVMVVLGEVLLLAGLLLAAGHTFSRSIVDVAGAVAVAPERNWIIALLLLGFGVKAGLPLLHVWLPLAHALAPTPASAVLSGAMLKAGLVGWLRFLPLGVVMLPVWSNVVVVLGLVGALGGALLGLLQDRPKAVLAYSSVSQMGFIVTGLGLALGASAAELPVAVAAIQLYAVHHGLAKGALFLGAGWALGGPSGRWRPYLTGGLVLAALALAGAPFTAGAIAKTALKGTRPPLSPAWADAFDLALSVAAVATTVVMVRFLVVLRAKTPPPGDGPQIGVAVPWLVSVVGGTVLVWAVAHELAPAAVRKVLSPAGFWSGFWPLGAGVTAAALVIYLVARGRIHLHWRVPLGDVLVPVGALGERLRSASTALSTRRVRLHRRRDPWTRLNVRLGRVETWFTRWNVAVAWLLVVTVALVLALSAGSFGF